MSRKPRPSPVDRRRLFREYGPRRRRDPDGIMFALESLRAVIDGVVTCLRIDDGASVEGEPSRAIVRDATALRGALVDLGRMLDEPEPEDEEEA